MLSDTQQVLGEQEHSDNEKLGIKGLPDQQQLSQDLSKHYNCGYNISAGGEENSNDPDQAMRSLSGTQDRGST